MEPTWINSQIKTNQFFASRCISFQFFTLTCCRFAVSGIGLCVNLVANSSLWFCNYIYLADCTIFIDLTWETESLFHTIMQALVSKALSSPFKVLLLIEFYSYTEGMMWYLACKINLPLCQLFTFLWGAFPAPLNNKGVLYLKWSINE